MAYTYDNNGNMLTDNGKGITIEYNVLNLPRKITSTEGTIEIWYDALGRKLRKKVTPPGANPVVEKEYAGGIEYADELLEAIYTREGRIIEDPKMSAGYRYEYTLSDHLGNGRVYFADLNEDGKIAKRDIENTPGNESEILQENHYYPFGLNQEGNWAEVQNVQNQYQYNGKELNADLGIDLLDYGARWYDPANCRWNGVDPLAADFAAWSPYNYVLGNPIRLVDPDGRAPMADIYNANGQWIGTDGNDDGRVLISSTADNTQLTQDQASFLITMHDFLGGYQRQTNGAGLTDLTVNHDELQLLAGAAYGEAGTGNVTEEIYGIASAIVNNNDLRGEGASLTETINDVAYAATDGNARFNAFDGATPTERNANAGMTTAVAG